MVTQITTANVICSKRRFPRARGEVVWRVLAVIHVDKVPPCTRGGGGSVCVALTILFPSSPNQGRNGRKGHWAEVKPDLDAAMQGERLASRCCWRWLRGAGACTLNSACISVSVSAGVRVCVYVVVCTDYRKCYCNSQPVSPYFPA